MAETVTSNVLRGWREQEYGRSRGGLPLRVQLPAAGTPVDGLLIAVQHGEEAETGLLARRLLERVHGDQTRWAVVQNVERCLISERLPTPPIVQMRTEADEQWLWRSVNSTRRWSR